MKKFLSLVLAMIMTLSLVTISAGATEYKDLTDKDEIQYEEAVAVLNRIGIITGYEDGSFRPETELTRGAAAKIIVSLLIGPDAANALPNASSPYPDVPASHTFAGVISYCKTAGIISGYGDGTFKPGNSLTGFAFAKMLLGALGYKSDVEGFTDTGWTMNVAKIGNAAGLFNRLNFDGSASVNREQACQLALNTLKATLVEYTGGFNVTAGDANVVGAQTRTFVISNQEYATHISNQRAGGLNSWQGNADVNNHYTVEFGEEHFKDLRMEPERDNYDAFGRPSNEWSYKKVTIGTYAVAPDFVYTTQVTHNVDTVSEASKVRALGLNGYELVGTDAEGDRDETTLWVNGVRIESDDSTATVGVNKVADIADYTDEGTVVEVYVSESDADFITDVVVIKTQLMDIKKIGSDYVTLELYDDGSALSGKYGLVRSVAGTDAYNSDPINVDVEDVEVNDECYEALKGMKVGDIVAVVPVSTNEDTSEYEVSRFYVPETVSGELTRVETYSKTSTTGDKNAVNVTVGGTEYKIALWNKKLVDIDSESIKVTRKDVTLYLDEFGNAMLATDVGSTSNFMVIGNYRTGLENGILVTYANGWDIKGNEVTLNIGSSLDLGEWKAQYPVGSLVHYRSAVNSNTADWDIDDLGVYNVFNGKVTGSAGTTDYEIKSSNSRVKLTKPTNYTPINYKETTDFDTTGEGLAYIDSGINFIYISIDGDREVDSFEIKSGMQNVNNSEINGVASTQFDRPNAQACVALKNSNTTVNDDSTVKAVVIKRESNDATINNLLYIRDYHGSATKTDGGMVQGYEVSMMTSEGVKDEVVYAYKDLSKGTFARYTKTATPDSASGVKGVTDDNFYTLRGYNQTKKAASVIEAQIELWRGKDSVLPYPSANNDLIRLTNPAKITRDNTLLTNIQSQYWNGKDVTATDYLNVGDGTAENLVNLKRAQWVDLTKWGISSSDDLEDVITGEDGPVYKNKTTDTEVNQVTVNLLYNDKIDHDDFRSVYMVVITDVRAVPQPTDDGQQGGDTTKPGVYDYNVDVNTAFGATVNTDGTKVSKTDNTFHVYFDIDRNAATWTDGSGKKYTRWVPGDALATVSFTLFGVKGSTEEILGSKTLPIQTLATNVVSDASTAGITNEHIANYDTFKVRVDGVTWSKVGVVYESSNLPTGITEVTEKNATPSVEAKAYNSAERILTFGINTYTDDETNAGKVVGGQVMRGNVTAKGALTLTTTNDVVFGASDVKVSNVYFQGGSGGTTVLGNAPLVVMYTCSSLTGITTPSRTFTSGITTATLDATQATNAGVSGRTLTVTPASKTGIDGESFSLNAALVGGANPQTNDVVKVTITDDDLSEPVEFYIGNGQSSAISEKKITFNGKDINLTNATVKVEKVENLTPVLASAKYVFQTTGTGAQVADLIILTFADNVTLDETAIAAGITFTDLDAGAPAPSVDTSATVKDNVVTIKLAGEGIADGDTMTITAGTIKTDKGASNKANIVITFDNITTGNVIKGDEVGQNI